ncbi:hypothetical protein [Halosimplex rubrum]|nr:hypothetical protein [Halosimplex rubrum]
MRDGHMQCGTRGSAVETEGFRDEQTDSDGGAVEPSDHRPELLDR